MMYESGRDRGQREMYPPSLEELIAENHPARVIDAFVDGLDMEYLGFTRSAPAWTGRPGYDPRALLKLYLSELDSYDESRETLHLDIPKSQMPAKLRELKERAAKYRGYQKRFEQGETQILETDPECRTLHSKDGLHPAYNVQTVADTKSHFITNFETTNANTDQNQLSVMGEVVKKELKRDCVHLIADKGFESRSDIEKCLMNGIIRTWGSSTTRRSGCSTSTTWKRRSHLRKEPPKNRRIQMMVQNGKSYILQRKFREYLQEEKYINFHQEGVRTEQERQYAMTFVVSGMVGMLEEWLKADEPEVNAQDLAHLVCRITNIEKKNTMEN